MQEDVEALHKLRRRALDPHDKHPAEAEKWKAEAEEFALGTALATPGGKWRHAALAQDIHQHNVSEPVLRQQRAKAVAEHASNQGDYEPGRRGQRELQRDVTERLRDHVGEQHATVVERLADSGIRGRAAREAVAGTHQAALGTVKHLHAEALQSIKEQGLHDAAMKAFRRARRKDAADTDIEDAFDAVGEAAQAAIPERTIGLVAQQNALRVTVWNGAELQKQVQQVAKINLFDNTTGLAEHLELFVADNVKLVKSLVFGQLDDLKGIVVRGARAGTHHTVVAEQIRERFGVTKKRAALIATDQVGKLNGELNQLRQTNLGVRRYRWSSSQDERVRKSHRKLNGSIQTWKDPPVVDQRTGERGHPGQPIRCRCQPIPIIDDVLADAGLMDPEDVELLHPAAGNVQPATKPWVPPKLPPLPSGVPQPPPANMAEAAAQAVRRAAAAPSGGTSSRTPANTNVPPSLPPRAPPAPPGGGGPPRGRGKPPGEPPSGAPGAGPLPDAPRPTKALVRRAAKLVTHDADYYDHGVDLSKLSAIDRQVFLSGPCVKLIDDAKNRAEYARWMDLWVGRSTAKLALEARRGIEVAGSAARDGYLATQAFIESRLGRLRTEGIIDPNGYVTLYRGVYDDNARAVRAQHAAGGAVSSRVRDAASWTDSLRSARAAAMGGDDGLVMHQKIHYTRIYSTYRANGYHWMRSPDAEWTVLHDDGIVEVQVMELL
jgi:SPP1 gp7 family putative phage head morphogenesis protein